MGETLEQAVAREVHEESAVAVDPASVAYAGSQPCAPARKALLQPAPSCPGFVQTLMRGLRAGPFPRSLMLAFRATAAPLEAPQTTLQARRPTAHAPLLSALHRSSCSCGGSAERKFNEAEAGAGCRARRRARRRSRACARRRWRPRCCRRRACRR